jgi:hypothetical protein
MPKKKKKKEIHVTIGWTKIQEKRNGEDATKNEYEK